MLAKQGLSASQAQSNQEGLPVSTEEAMVPEMELDEDSADSTPASSLSPQQAVKPKQRLSFSNKVPEVKKVKKREINGLHAFAIIVLFCIVVIAGTWMKVNRDKQEFAGIETNSNVLRPMDEAKEGLQANNKKDGQAPDSENTQQERVGVARTDLNSDRV